MTGTRTHGSWCAMIQRCFDKKYSRYKYYGGRGITVCPEWLEFANFYKDIGERPEGKSLDRIKNHLCYSKENCKWSTRKEQANNKRNNRLLTYQNKTQTMKQWAEEFDINYRVFQKRLKLNWSIKKALTNINH